MLILRTLILGPAHGHEIAKHIQRSSDEVLRLEHGSLYPALHRLERKGWLASKWDTHREHNRECKYYRLTPAGRKQLAAETSKWSGCSRPRAGDGGSGASVSERWQAPWGPGAHKYD
jgi:transcriptional regulator